MAVARLCLDSSAYSRFRLDVRDAVTALDEAHEIGVPVIVLGELRAGFKLGLQAGANERKLREFLANPVVRLLDVDDAATGYYADLMADLRRRGRPVPTNDVWIAALALREGLTILTADRHFQDIKAVNVILLPETPIPSV